MSVGGIDLGRLGEWMDAQGIERGAIADAALLTGGTQNVLMRFRRGERTFVLRRPPANPRPGNNATMLREARVLGALAGSDVPHPALIAVCADPDVLGAAFYLMDNVAGFNATVGLPPLHAGDPAIRHVMGLALVDGAAALGRVDHRAVGLADFGNADDFLARQVARWQGQLDGYVAMCDWPGREGLPGVDAIAAWLADTVPSAFTPGVIHGDYSIGNVMYRDDGPGLAAIIDWELATIGDPLIDLGWIMATWPGAGGPELAVLRVDPWHGFPAIGEMVERYRAQTSRDMSRIDWYAVLACYKLAILLEGTFARACAGKAPMAVGERLHDTAVRLLQRAEYRIEAMPCAG